jgi:predicted unusual protein kinase regulating ubiquinone biosynthesis (AarF/ABC1/UbiB family)
MARIWNTWRRRNRIWRSYRVALLLLRTLYVINRERNRVINARARGEFDVRPDVEALLRILREFRRTAEDLGGLLIKLGQFLGARADLLPQEALDELSALHDDVPQEPYADIERVLEREWHAPVSEICAVIDPQTAGSASLGQVHRAQLHDGRWVAIKVQRPGIAAIVRTDLRTLRFVLRLVGWLVPAANRITDLRALYREFSRTVSAELDYRQEARNAERFAEIVADNPRILVPGVIAAYSTRHVLVLDWMDGIKIADIDVLDAAGVDRESLARRLVGTYLHQILEIGFYHADPHPGNLLVQPDSAGDRLIFVDFGLMGTVTPRMRTGLRDCFIGVMMNDAPRVIRGLDALGFLSETANREALEPIVEMLMSHLMRMNTSTTDAYTALSSRQAGVHPREMLGDVTTTLYDQPFRLPAQFAFFGRMAGMLLGVTSALAPGFDFIAAATPYAEEFLGGNEQGVLGNILQFFGVESTAALGQAVLREGIATAQSFLALPRRVDRVLERAERGQLHLIVENSDGASRNGKGAGNVLSRPVPMWVPLSLVGALGLVTLARRGRRNAVR